MVIVKNLNELDKFVESFLDQLKKEPIGEKAKIVCLRGHLGAGKTAFVKKVAKKLDIEKNLTSPTFVILKTYKLKTLDLKTLVHIDAYRLKEGKDLKHLGWKEIINNPQNLVFIEWPENVSRIIPKEAVIIEFEVLEESKRKITIIWPKKKKRS